MARKSPPKFKRVLLKLSGEVLKGPQRYGIDGTVLQQIAGEIRDVCKIGTEIGILHRLQKENPEKVFHPASERATCPNMKLTTLEKVLWSLEEMRVEVTVPQDIMNRARTCLRRMIDYKP